MTDDDDDANASIPWDALHRLVEWMSANGVDQLHLVAKPRPDRARPEDPLREESRSLFYCDEAPEAFGLHDIYAVTDGDGRARLNGPSYVPRDVLHPVLRALDEASVAEVVIAAVNDDQAQPVAGRALTTTLGEFEEGGEPLDDGYSPVIISVREEAE